MSKLKTGDSAETGCPRHNIRYPLIWNGNEWEGDCPLCEDDPPPERELEPLCRFFEHIATAYYQAQSSRAPLSIVYRAVGEALLDWESNAKT